MSKVFISYSHDSSEHLDRVLALSNRLRGEGVDCRIDQDEQSPAEGWPLWCARQVEHSTFVLVACTETYRRRFNGEEAPRTGLGGTWEGHIITQELYNAEGRNTKFVPIIFSKDDRRFVPVPLQSATRYQLSDEYAQLYRRLTDQPLISMPILGSVKPMPAREPLPSLPSLERKANFQTVWHAPYSRNPFFTGREKILEDLRQALERRSSAALSGLGGMGKTQTAIEYAYRHREIYTAVFWAKAESRDTLAADFVSIAVALNLPSADAKEQEVTVAEVKRWLETSPGWLLILDNADDLDLAKEFLPRDPQGHLLLTTRARALGGLAERVLMETMVKEEGALLVLRRAGLAADNASLSSVSQTEQSIALRISEELGGLPLALDQAGAFIEETPSSLSDYLQLYLAERDKLLAERGSLGDHSSVAVTFSLAFAKVAGNSAAAADLIRLCAFLAPDAIPEEIITRGTEELGDDLGAAARSSLEFAKVLKEAGRFSLLDRDAQSKTLDIHRLVQVVVQAGMSDVERNDWAERTVRAVAKAFPWVEFENWGLCQKLLPHAQACDSLIITWDFAFQEAAVLLNQAGYYLCQRAFFAEAEPLYRRALSISEKALGPDHPDTVQVRANLDQNRVSGSSKRCCSRANREKREYRKRRKSCMNDDKERTSASEAAGYLRPGLKSITPYVVVRDAGSFIKFLEAAFGGTERLRMPRADGSIMHAEVEVGNGAIELGEASSEYSAAPGAIHLYVDDADATYERAVQAGAEPIYPVADQHWGDRQGAVKDHFGNHWYIAKAGWTPGPEGIPSVQPFLHLHDAEKMIPFAEAAFGAEALGVAKSPEGMVLHATIRIGNATFEIDEAQGEFQPMPCHLHVYVPDTDAAYARAIKAGATSVGAPKDEPYGDRSAGVKDAWGNSWFIATYLAQSSESAPST